MFVKVNREDILEGVHKSANIIPAKTGAAYLRTIWLKSEEDGLRIMSTDSNLEFTGIYNAQIQGEGLAGVQGRAFYDLIRKLPPGEILIRSEKDGRNLLIEQGKRKYKLPVNDPSWFQNFSEFPDGETVFWSGDFLHEIIDKISFCISEEDSMEAIACLNLVPVEGPDGNMVEVCGLNGHQFAMFKFLNDDVYNLLPREGVLIQKRYLSELKKWLTEEEIELSMTEKRLFFRTANKSETFSLPLSNYQYPNYKNFLGKLDGDGVSTLQVGRVELMDSLERILIFNTEHNRYTNFMFNGGDMVLYSQGQDVGTATESIEVAFNGAIDKIAFPTRHLIDILGHFASDSITMTLSGAEAPCGITGQDDQDYLVILMPMKIQEQTYYSEEEA